MVKPGRFFHGTRLQSATLILLSILVGAGTYLYLLNYQSQIKETNRLQPIYVATSEIPSGTSFGEIISTSLLEIRELPAAAIPLGAIGPSSQIENSLRSRGVLSPGQIMVASFFSSEARSDTGLPIPKGKLAITISVDDVARVGNFVSPGSRVVVFATSTTNSGTAQTRILLPEVLVIGIGNQTNLNLANSMPMASPMVTLALEPSEAERLILAEQTSILTLALAYQNDPISVLDIAGAIRTEN